MWKASEPRHLYFVSVRFARGPGDVRDEALQAPLIRMLHEKSTWHTRNPRVLNSVCAAVCLQLKLG